MLSDMLFALKTKLYKGVKCKEMLTSSLGIVSTMDCHAHFIRSLTEAHFVSLVRKFAKKSYEIRGS